MDAETVREYCLSKTNVTESFPFGNDTLVFKVSDKIFLLLALNQNPLRFNVKCDPEKAVELREKYDSIKPGYHMNKKLWNTVIIDGSLSLQLLKQMIDNSYMLVIHSLPSKVRKKL